MIPKVDPELLNRAFETVSMVEDGTVVPIRSLAGKTIELQDQTIKFNDNPILRMVEATRIVFPDRIEGLAASMRLFYLFALLDEPKVSPLVRIENGNLLVHGSLVRAMAEVAIDEEGMCDIDELEALAKKHLKVFMGLEAKAG
jgi:hypothetical protein